MAINPNTDFTTGAVLTAAQQNRFPRGVMAYNQVTTSDTNVNATEKVTITGSSFTAVANRYYRITYFEPNPYSGTGYIRFSIRLTNLTGTLLQYSFHTMGSGVERTGTTIWVGTLSAGTTNVVGTVLQASGTSGLSRAATFPAFLCVEDIGPA